jgi:hypothetical protein
VLTLDELDTTQQDPERDRKLRALLLQEDPKKLEHDLRLAPGRTHDYIVKLLRTSSNLDNPTKGFFERLKREGCIFTNTVLRDELITQLAVLGVPAGAVTIEAKAVPAGRPDTDPQTLYVRYPPLYDPNPYIADEVRVEVSVRSLQMPFTHHVLRSILSKTFSGAAYPEEPFTDLPSSSSVGTNPER